jgi:DNA-binding IclR family transcriptional regulator
MNREDGPPIVSPGQRDDLDGAAAEGVGVLDRASAILGAFDPDHRELTLAALVRRCGLPRSTTHRTADRMLRLGWLDKPLDRYRIGNRLFELSGLTPIRHELREAALPYLQDLFYATGTTVQLGVLDGPNVLIVEKISGHRPMPMLSQVGARIPAHCSGLGRAILAHSVSSVVDGVIEHGLVARTTRTITSVDALKRELATIPTRGWAMDLEEGNPGVTCVAAPIFGRSGEPVAAVSVTGPSRLVDPGRVHSAVQLAAASVSRSYSARRA